MKNTEIIFYSFKQFRYSSLYIGRNGDSGEVFHLFSMYRKDKAFQYLKNQSFFWQFQVMFHMYLDIGRDDDNGYDDEESSSECYYK